MASVRLRGQLKQLAGDRAEHELGGATVLDVLRALERAQPPLDGWVLDERSQIRPHINVFVNGERAEVGTGVGAGDRLEVIPAISGG